MSPIETETALYPRTVQLPSGARVTLRLMNRDDRERVMAMARDMPVDDLLFLRRDITQPPALDDWLDEIEHGRSKTVIAEHDGRAVGYGALHFNQTTWTRHRGDIRVLVAEDFRGQKLGKLLVQECVRQAREIGLQKLTAQMTMDQTEARAMFHRLGFQVEAMLPDWVLDRNGEPRDLLVMSRDVQDLA